MAEQSQPENTGDPKSGPENGADGYEPSEEVEELFDDANGDLALGELDDAAKKYAECVEREPGFFDGWHALAMCLVKLDRTEEAIAAGLKAVEINPNDQLIWTALSQIYVKNGQIKEAEDAKAKARIVSWGGRVDRMKLD